MPLPVDAFLSNASEGCTHVLTGCLVWALLPSISGALAVPTDASKAARCLSRYTPEKRSLRREDFEACPTRGFNGGWPAFSLSLSLSLVAL